MPMCVTHVNNLRESPLQQKYFNVFFIIYMTHSANLVSFRCVVLAYWHLQNPNLGPAIITQGCIFFFLHPRIEIKYTKVFITFDPLILFFISPTFQL